MKPEDFQLGSAQASAFTPDLAMSASLITSKLMPKWAGIFDGEPTILPNLDGFPREVPRIILTNAAGNYRCEIAAARINLIWRKKRAVDEPALPDYFAESTSVLGEYMEVVGCKVDRLAAVVSRVAPDENPGLFLARHFCRDEWADGALNRPENFELHAHKAFDMEGFTVNSWVRNKSATLTVDGKASRIVLVEQDLNTITGDFSYDFDAVKRYFAVVGPQLDQILGLYYGAGA
jgi:hypothetical protein